MIRLLLVALIAGTAAYVLTRHFSPAPAEPASEIAWLSAEFELTAGQTAEVSALHEAYRPICDRHCAAIIEARSALRSVDSPADRKRAETQLVRLQQTCLVSTRAHLEAVAAVMDPAQGERYLALIEPRLSVHQHAEPFGLK